MTLSADLLRRLPKAELHIHLDGSLRPATMIELAREQAVDLPVDDPDALADFLLVRDARSLEEYLDRYVVTLSVMRTPAALERIAREFVEDTAADGTRYVEVRYCPALHGPEVSGEVAVDAVLGGLRAGEAAVDHVTTARVILCGLRTLPPSVSCEMAELAVQYRDRGVVGFDLAGAEAGYPPEPHAEAFAIAGRGGLALTCHAGEAAGPESIRGALDTCHARRIGHGVRLREDPALLDRVRADGIPLEMCPTSNVHTGTVPDLVSHPFRTYLDDGIRVTLNTDSRLMDRLTLTEEYRRVCEAFGFTREEVDRLILGAFEVAFLPEDERAALVGDVAGALRKIA